jgi:MFS transporter, DHA1 family, tetracycline resistance protein
MKRSPLLPIFLVVLVDVLGFTIVYPLLPLYAEKFGASPLIATTLVSVYALCSLFSTPVIGRMSDQFGRRRLLLISQAGTFAGFIVLAVSSNIYMVFLGRILDGLTAGNLSTAQAYISDHTEAKDRAKAFGIIGIAFGIGFFIGPVLTAVLVRFGEHAPFLVAAGLSAGSMVCTYMLLVPDGGARGASDGATGPGGKRPALFDVATYLAYFRRPGLGAMYLQFFCFCFAFSAFMSGFSLFAERRFRTSDGLPWTAREVGYIFAYVGFLGIILQGGLLGRMVKRMGELRLVIVGFVAVVIAYVMLGFAETIALLVVMSTISAFGNSALRPVITSLLTQRVGRHEQGVALGISGSLNSLAMTVAPPIGGSLIDRHRLVAWTLVPAAAAAVGLITALVSRARALPETVSHIEARDAVKSAAPADAHAPRAE